MKKTLLLFIILLLTGCRAQYNLKLNFNGTVIEDGSVYINTNLLGKEGYSNDAKEFLDEIASQNNFSNYISKKKIIESDYVGYSFSHKYKDIKFYSNNSPVVRTLFGGLSVKTIDHYTILKTYGRNKMSDYHNLKKDTPTIVENISVSITLPYRVVKHNATRVDTTSNTYTWVFNGNTCYDIDLEYRDNELYSMDLLNLLKFVGWYVYVTIALVIAGLIVILKIKSLSNIRNKI